MTTATASYKLLDVNPRIGGTFRLFVGPDGTDVLRALYLDLTGQAIPPTSEPDGRRWIVEPQDLISSLAYRRRGDITRGRVGALAARRAARPPGLRPTTRFPFWRWAGRRSSLGARGGCWGR